MPDEKTDKPEGNVVDLKPKEAEQAPEEQQVPTEMQHAMVAQLAGMIAPFCPNMDEPALLQLAAEGIAEQGAIHEQIMPTLMANHPHSKEYPSLRVVALGPDGTQGAVAGPKRLEGVNDVGPAVQHAMIVGLLLTPSARMVLKAWGFQVRFEQLREDTSTPPPKIHLA